MEKLDLEQDLKDALQLIDEVTSYLGRLPRVEATLRMERQLSSFLSEKKGHRAPFQGHQPAAMEATCYTAAGLPFLQVDTDGLRVSLRIPTPETGRAVGAAHVYKHALRALSEGIDVDCRIKAKPEFKRA